MPYAVGTFASRAAVMSGSAIHLAATRTREKALRIAADALEASVDDLEIVDGVVSVRGTPDGIASIDLGTVAVLSNPLRYAFDEASQGGHPVLRRRPRQAAGRRGRRAGSRGPRLLQPGALDVRLRACTR